MLTKALAKRKFIFVDTRRRLAYPVVVCSLYYQPVVSKMSCITLRTYKSATQPVLNSSTSVGFIMFIGFEHSCLATWLMQWKYRIAFSTRAGMCKR
jgi:hypothetical protein